MCHDGKDSVKQNNAASENSSNFDGHWLEQFQCVKLV